MSPTSLTCAIAAADRLIAAMKSGASQVEIDRRRAEYDYYEGRAITQLEAWERMGLRYLAAREEPQP